MKQYEPNLSVQVDLTNPGQFFACCGLLELADRMWPGTEGWFSNSTFHLAVSNSETDRPFLEIIQALTTTKIGNTMTPEQLTRLEELGAMSGKERSSQSGLDEKKKELEALRRESPIILSGPTHFRVDWFLDDFAGGSRFKTWAGQQSVLDIAIAMQSGIKKIDVKSESQVWSAISSGDLPFNFDSDLGGQGSPLDIGFSLDPLASSESTRIDGVCRPVLELLCFIGLQRFRPKEFYQTNGVRENRFAYSAWRTPFSPQVAAAFACCAMTSDERKSFEFRLLYRTKYLKSFLPSTPLQGEYDE